MTDPVCDKATLRRESNRPSVFDHVLLSRAHPPGAEPDMLDRSHTIFCELDVLVTAAGLGPKMPADAFGVWQVLDDTITTLLGFDLTVRSGAVPVTFAWFAPDVRPEDIGSSISVPLRPTPDRATTREVDQDDPRSAVVLRVFAGTPGAFVDLAADLTVALSLDPPITETATTSDVGDAPTLASVQSSNPRVHDQWHIRLDTDLTPTVTTTSTRGLNDLDTVNQAVGVLIDRGHHPDAASDELQRQARAADVSVTTQAQRILSAVGVEPH